MNEKDWEKYQELHAKYEEAREAYHAAQMNLRGTFSELARHFEPGTLNESRFVVEEEAHQHYQKARDKFFSFIKDKTGND